MFATGCIYSYDASKGRPCPEGNVGQGGEWAKTYGFKEEDEGNFGGSWYSYTKKRVEEVCSLFLLFDLGQKKGG